MYLIEYSILSTDLAVYFRKKNQFISVVENGEWNWQDPDQKECNSNIYRLRKLPFHLQSCLLRSSVNRNGNDFL